MVQIDENMNHVVRILAGMLAAIEGGHRDQKKSIQVAHGLSKGELEVEFWWAKTC